MHTTPSSNQPTLRDLQAVMIRVQIKALETLERFMQGLVKRNPDAIWFDDYADRVIYDEAGLFDYQRVDKDKIVAV